MKRIKQIIAFCLSLSMVFALVACSGAKESSDNSADTSLGQVWSAPSTVKIRQDDIKYSDKGKAELTYKTVRNEYENYQLLISAKKDITHFDLQTSDLKNGDKTLTDENVTVYMQKYIPINDSTGSGYVPDALIPIDVADEYKENVISAGTNGALWITVYIPKETEEGTYKGTYKLSMKNEKEEVTVDIPVSITVYDYTLTDDVNAKTLFSWRYNRVAPGELDGSIEMMECYYEFFKDYRISLQSLPLETLSGEEFITSLLKYYDQISTYTILSKIGDISTDLLSYPDKVREQICAVAAASTTEKNLFDKAMIYIIDEPDFTLATGGRGRSTVIPKLEQLRTLLQSCVDIIKADNSGTYSNFKQISNWENSILDIPNVIPTGVDSLVWLMENQDTEDGKKLMEHLNCVCPGFVSMDDRRYNKVYPFLEENDIDLWWYGTGYFALPGPSYFLGDMNLLSSRTLSWMQKKQNVVGNLYWDAAAYTDEAPDYYNEYINLYESPYHMTHTTNAAGDGHLTYAGAAYGVYGPLPSLRLMSIRDGMEEYEILNDIEMKYQELASSFGSEFSVEMAMGEFYKDIAYDGCAVMTADGQYDLDFEVLREKLLQLAAGLEDGLAFALGDVVVKGTKANFTYYVQEGSTATIGEKLQQPVSGNKYQYEIDLEKNTNIQVVVSDGNGKTVTYDRFVAKAAYELNALSDSSALNEVSVTAGSKLELVENSKYSTDGSSIRLNVNGNLTGNELIDAVFVPAVSIFTEPFGEYKPADLSRISIDLYNPGEQFTMIVRLYSGNTYVDFGSYEIKSGNTTLNLNLMLKEFSNIETADRIAFEFPNTIDDKLTSYEFYIDNIVGEK